MLVAHHLGVHAGQVEVGRAVLAASGEDDFGVGWLAQQGLDNWFDWQQLQVDRGVDLIKDHGLVETAGDGGAGNFPGPFGFDVVDRLLLAAPHNGIAARAQVIHQVGVALAQGGDGGIFGVSLAALEPLQDQHPVAFVLADSLADGLQGFAKGAGGFPLAFAGVDLDAVEAIEGGFGLGMGPHFGVEVSELNQLGWSPPAGADHLHTRWLGGQGAGHFIAIEQAQIEHGVELIEDHH